MTEWWWVRHAPTHEKAFCGWRDVPADLSDGQAIARLKTYLPADATLVSSDLSRAIKTADAIAADQPRLPHDADLRELNFGDWDGRRFDDVAQSHPETSRAYWDTPGDIAPPGGESWHQACARINAAVDRIHHHHTGHVIAVAHFGTILTQVQRALNCSGYAAFGHKIDNLSVTRLRFDGTWQAHSINHIV